MEIALDFHHHQTYIYSTGELMDPYTPDAEVDIAPKSDVEVKEPSLYRVFLHNDDYTTMEFVVEILMYVFQKAIEEATLIMLNVHRKGIGLCGIYPYAVAETKVATVNALAREQGFPLKCTMERE